MNALTIELGLMQWDETDAMNALQEHGLISDCAVTAEDVAPSDALAAVEWLRENKRLWKKARNNR